jgi:virulence-associated protein VagC
MNNISLLRDAESELCGLLRAGTDEITAYHATLALTHLKGKSKETFDILAERIHKQWQEISGPQGSNPGRHHALQISLRALEPCVTDKRLIGELMEMTRLPMVVMDHFNWREESVLALGRLGTGNVEVIEHLLTVLRLLLSKPNSSRDLVSCLWSALGETGIGLQGCSADIEELAAHTNGHAKILAVWAMTRLGVRPLSDLLNWPIADAWEVKAFINALDALTIPEERTLAVERLRLLIETEELAKIISPAQQDSDGWVTQGPYKGHGDEPRKHVLAVLEHLDCPIDVLHRLGGDIWQRVKRNQSAVGIDVMRISESMLGQKSTESYFNEGALLLGMIKADVATAIHNLAACLGKQKFGSTYLSFNLTGIRIGHDPNVNAIWALGEIGAASSEALPFLRHLCKDPDWRVRLVAEKAVEKVSDRQIEAQ